MIKKISCLIIIASIFLLAACSVSDRSAPNIQSVPNVQQIETKVILAQGEPIIKLTEWGNVVVEGIVRNDGNRQATFVQAEATFFDTRNYIIGKSSGYLDSLAPGQSWKYEIMYLGINTDQVSYARVKVTWLK